MSMYISYRVPIVLLVCSILNIQQNDCWEIVSSRHDREDAPMKTHHYGWLNKTCIMATTVDMPKWTGKVSQGFILGWKATDNQWMLRENEFVFSRDKLPRLARHKQVVSPKCLQIIKLKYFNRPFKTARLFFASILFWEKWGIRIYILFFNKYIIHNISIMLWYLCTPKCRNIICSVSKILHVSSFLLRKVILLI